MGDPGIWRSNHNLDFSSTDQLLNDKNDSDNWSICTKCKYIEFINFLQFNGN